MTYSLSSQKILNSYSLACLVSFQVVVLDISSYPVPKLLTENKTSFITVNVGTSLRSPPPSDTVAVEVKKLDAEGLLRVCLFNLRDIGKL